MPIDQSDLRSYVARVVGADALETPFGGGLVDHAFAAGPPGSKEHAASALEKVQRGESLTPPEQFVLEAIIIPDKRPAIRVIGGGFTVTHPMWMHWEEKTLKKRIRERLPSVGRIDLPRHPSIPYGGTGFVVGEGLLMTNRHVAELFTVGVGSRELLFQSDLDVGVDFKRETPDQAAALLTVREVVMIHPYWDMALLRVDGLTAAHKPIPLSLAAPADLVGREVAVIGYPAFDPRNDRIVQDQVFEGVYNVKRLQPGLLGGRAVVNSFGKALPVVTHDGSTLGGDSGALVLDVTTGEAVALHFAGQYLKANYCMPTADLAQDGRVIDAGLSFSGAAQRRSGDWDGWWSRFDGAGTHASGGPARGSGGSGDPPPPPPPPGETPSVGGASLAAGQTVTWTLPLEISVRIGAPLQGGPSILTAGLAPIALVEKMVEPFHVEDLGDREGYRPDFLGPTIPLPSGIDADIVAPVQGGGHELKYQHFSVVMHKARRIALFTASNIDGTGPKRRPEPAKDYTRKGLTQLGEGDIEKWFPDPRVAAEHQLPDKFLSKDAGAFDKGHIVRREDVCWGDSWEEIRKANGDTYHMTNCSPQVSGFNQSARGEENWGDLENYVMRQAQTSRLSLLAGPVLSGSDKTFAGVDDSQAVHVKIPAAFWKVVLATGPSGLEAYGFLLQQDLSSTLVEGFAVDAVWRSHMIALDALQERLLFRLPAQILAADQTATQNGQGVRQTAGVSSFRG